MIAILDPAILLTTPGSGPLAPEEEKALAALVDDVSRICRENGARIPSLDWYWRRLQIDFVRPLLRRATGPRLRQGLDKWQQYAARLALPDIPHGRKQVWGIKPLFDWHRLPAGWLGIMERLLIGAAQLGEPSVLVTRLFPGRNADLRAVAGATLTAKTRWRVILHIPGCPPTYIPCVRNPRNIAVPWTTRFDDKLPDRGRYPFCPPGRWWRRDVKAHDAVRSKPAWLDCRGNGWAQPATGGDYHWDVFIEDPNLQESVGLTAINVVTWGSTEAGKTPGEIHHVPAGKRAHFRGGGWTCPPAA